MVTGGNTALDPSRQSYQLQREGSLAYKEPNILTAATRPLPTKPPTQRPSPNQTRKCSASHAANTKPHSPTTTGKVERFHKTLRVEFLNGKTFASVEAAQAALDAWVDEYNQRRPHQGIGQVPPYQRFRLAEVKPGPVETPQVDTAIDAGPVTTRRVNSAGAISFATAKYKAGGRWLAGQTVEVVCEGGLVQIFHRGVLVATHARRHPLDKQTAGVARGRTLRPSRPTATAASVTRKVDSAGGVCFAGTHYRVGNQYRRRQVQVAVVGDTVEISVGAELIRSHKVRHDRTREHGALANPGGRPHRINAA